MVVDETFCLLERDWRKGEEKAVSGWGVKFKMDGG